MLKTFQFRLYPNKSQQAILEKSLEEACFVYNQILNLRKTAWENDKKAISRYDSTTLINPLVKDKTPHLHSQTIQQIGERIELAYKAFFRRLKNGETPGYPRFKSPERYKSLTFPQSGFKIKDERVYISKIGTIKTVFHRPLEGEIKRLTIKRNSLDQWFASFQVEILTKAFQPKTNKVIGIDLGVGDLITCSNGNIIKNPKFLKQKIKELNKIGSKLDKASTEKEKEKFQFKFRKLHIKVSNQRKDFLHKLSRKLVQENDIICLENIEEQKLIDKNKTKQENRDFKNYTAPKSFYDASWDKFLGMISYKAEEADKKLILVNPRNTSKTCSKCGQINLNFVLDQKIFKCPLCEHVENRNINASHNILRLGLQSLGLSN